MQKTRTTSSNTGRENCIQKARENGGGAGIVFNRDNNFSNVV
jgi:hypothetical protein